MALALKAIERLRKAANLTPAKRTVTLNNREVFEFYCKPLTMAERDRASKDAKSDEAGAFALQLLVNKALDENGTRLFTVGDIPTLKHEVRDSDLQAMMLAVLQAEEGEEEPLDPKSPAA